MASIDIETFGGHFYHEIFNIICSLSPHEDSYKEITEKIDNKFDLISELNALILNDKILLVEYFMKEAEKDLIASQTETYCWTKYFTYRRYQEKVFIANYIKNMNDKIIKSLNHT